MSFGHNKEFLKNPVAYLGGITVVTVGTQFSPSVDGFKTQESKSPIYMDLVSTDTGMKSGSKQARADFSLTSRGGDSDIVAGWIPYVDEGTVNGDSAKLPALELPASGNPVFAFTGAMNGCSLVLATKGSKNRGIHVPNSKQATLGFPSWLASATPTSNQPTLSARSIAAGGSWRALHDRRVRRLRRGQYNTFAFFLLIMALWTIVAATADHDHDRGWTANRKSAQGISFVSGTTGMARYSFRWWKWRHVGDRIL